MRPSDKFIKLMMMTTSTNDAEALVALRKANAMMAGARMNWSEFLLALAKQSEPQRLYEPSRPTWTPKPRAERKPRAKPKPKADVGEKKYTNKHQIDFLFARVYKRHLNETASEFVKGLHHFLVPARLPDRETIRGVEADGAFALNRY
jgi:hypothetical protein